jgi:hypothetical protein
MSISEKMTDPEEPIVKLAKIIREEAPVLLVGAGLSMLADYPSWNRLIRELLKAFPNPRIVAPAENEQIQSADRLADAIYAFIPSENRRKWDEKLRDVFSPNGVGCIAPVHIELLKLPFSGVVTTNYDHVMEEAAQRLRMISVQMEELTSHSLPPCTCSPINLCVKDDLPKVQDFLRSLRNNRSQSCNLSEILHIHGHYSRPGNLVLRRSEYERHYGDLFATDGNGAERTKFSEIGALLSGLFFTTPVVFFGFSMADAFVCETMMNLWRRFGVDQTGWNEKHYVVLDSCGVDPDAKRAHELSEIGVKAVFYNVSEPKENEDYLKGLIEFIAKLSDNINGVDASSSKTPDNPKPPTAGDEDLKIDRPETLDKSVNDLTARTLQW